MELFSDGVFVIVLTLLVLDLKPPADPYGWNGIIAVLPGLIVHAVTFFVIGTAWLQHHNVLVRVHVMTSRALRLNLLSLFWVTLMPFGARIAAEHPMAPLGVGMLNACLGLSGLSNLAMRLGVRSAIDEDPDTARIFRGRLRLWISVIIALLASALLSWVSPWFGYGAMISISLTGFLMGGPVEIERKALKRRATTSFQLEA